MGMFTHAKKAIDQSDIVVEVLDARFPELTRHFRIEQWIVRKHKKLVFALNKTDLITKATAEKHKQALSRYAETVFLSAKQKQGTGMLRKTLQRMAFKPRTIVAIIGYPNTGKSSLLNTLVGRKAAKTASQAGYTRGRQLVKMDTNLFLIDSPGVIPLDKRDDIELALVGAKSPNQLPDCVGSALGIIQWMHQQNPKSIRENFGTNETNPELVLEQIAIKKKKLIQGGKPDIENTAKIFIAEWQKGKIKI